MYFLRKKFEGSAIYVRVAPFAIFLALTFCQGTSQTSTPFFFYLVKTIVGAWLLWEMRPYVAEMKWAFSVEAVLVGIAVFVMWVGIDNWYPKFSKAETPLNPHIIFGQNSGTAWFFIMVHLLGSTFVVPPLEEIFYRSFLYRYFVKIDFLAMPFSRFHPLSFVVTSVLFGFEHYQWLSGILCGIAFQALVIRKNRIGDAITAHAITNFLLGVWVFWKGAWNFW